VRSIPRRLKMTKLVIFAARQAGLSEEEFRAHLVDVHLPLVRRMPGLRKVVLHRVLPRSDGLASEWDAVAEDWFESSEALQAALSSAEGQAVNGDAASFLDLTKLQFLVLEEEHNEEL
jgi:uncharacterized protein (TIGR02118 family)